MLNSKSIKKQLKIINIIQLVLFIIYFIISIIMIKEALSNFNPVSTWEFSPSYSGPLVNFSNIIMYIFMIVSLYRFILIKTEFKIIYVLNMLMLYVLFSNIYNNVSMNYKYPVIFYMFCILLLFGILYTHRIGKYYDDNNDIRSNKKNKVFASKDEIEYLVPKSNDNNKDKECKNVNTNINFHSNIKSVNQKQITNEKVKYLFIFYLIQVVYYLSFFLYFIISKNDCHFFGYSDMPSFNCTDLDNKVMSVLIYSFRFSPMIAIINFVLYFVIQSKNEKKNIMYLFNRVIAFISLIIIVFSLFR